MAIEQLQFAPVITPGTLRELARILREKDRRELAEVVSDLLPVVEELVENQFRPLSYARNPTDLRDLFDKKSREYEPYRLYINMTLLQSLDPANFLKFYSDVLIELNEMLFRSADAKQIPAQRVKDVFDGYFATFRSLVNVMVAAGPSQAPNRVETVNLASWIRSATSLDYGLTSLVLILEEAISAPARPVLESLVIASEESLDSFADQCRALTRGIRSERSNGGDQEGSLRTRELDWLKEKQRTGALRELAGQWIVVEKDRLIANDTSYEGAKMKAREAGITRPFVIFVPEATEPAFMGL